jgi:hypothetical protein
MLLLGALLALQPATGAVVAVTADVSVVDGSNRAITGLTAADFVVELDGQPRRVVAATFHAAGTPMAGAIGPVFDAVSGAASIYRLVVQPPDQTAPGRAFAIHVTVKRSGAKIQAPASVAAAPVTVTGTRTPAAPKSTDERLRDAIATGRSESTIPMHVARALVRRDAATLTLFFRVRIAGAMTPPLTALLGLVDGSGRIVTATPLVRPDPDGGYRVDEMLGVEPGAYKVRFAVTDSTGAVGVIESALDARLHAMGPLLASDLIRWTVDPRDQPTPMFEELPAAESETRVSLELYPAAGAAPPGDVVVRMELAGVERIVSPEVRDGVLYAEAWFPLDRVAAGTYTIRATVSSANATLGTVSATVVKR